MIPPTRPTTIKTSSAAMPIWIRCEAGSRRAARIRRPLSRRQSEHRGGDGAGPFAGGIAAGRRGDRHAVDDEVAELVEPLPLVPGSFGVEIDAEGGGEHRRREILRIVPAFLGGHAVTVMLGDVAIHGGLGRP